MRFPLSDVFLPDAENVRKALSLDSEVEGTIVDFSDSGVDAKKFALVKVVRETTVVVASGSLQLIEKQPGPE